MAGIDIEPADGIHQIDRIEISNCLMANNSGGGIDISLGFIISQPRPVLIHIANVTLRNNSAGVSAGNLVDSNGSISFEDTLIDGTCAAAINMQNKGTDGPSLSFRRLAISNHGQATSGFRPNGCESISLAFVSVIDMSICLIIDLSNHFCVIYI